MEQTQENFPLVFKKFHSKNNHGKYIVKRIMSKSGQINLQPKQVPYYKYFRFTKDFANTLVIIRWRWVTLFVILANFFFYVVFGGMWMLDAWLSGDFDANKTENFCIDEAKCFTKYLLLSIETITTTGYGYLYPSEYCQFAWFTMLLSTIVMIMIDGAFISVVFLKVFKPLKKDAATLFSRKCVISLRNGKLCLLFKIYDYLNKHLIDPKISIYLIERQSISKTNFQIYISELDVASSGMLLWPTDIVHVIDKRSPFWNMSATDIMNEKFEIFLTVSGSSLVTNQFAVSQTSFLNEDILWGYRFKSCMEFDENLQKYVINKQDVFKILPCDTPLCSARKLRDIKLGLCNKNQQ